MHKALIKGLFVLLFTAVCALPAEAQNKVCSSCGAPDVPELAMNCPDCGASLTERQLKKQLASRGSLKVKVFYTGNDVDSLPPYGKVYINGIYKGNIDLAEKQEPNENTDQVWASGLGRDFTAYYEKTVKGIQAGVMKVEIEMKFERMHGLGRSYKRVEYPYVGFKDGEETLLEHKFKSIASFSRKSTDKFETPQLPAIVSEAKIQGASGTVAVNIPLF